MVSVQDLQRTRGFSISGGVTFTLTPLPDSFGLGQVTGNRSWSEVSEIVGRADYNGTRPHSQFGWQTPVEFAKTFNPRRAPMQRSMKSSAPSPAASPTLQGKSNAGNELRNG